MILVLSPTLFVCLSWVGLAEAGALNQEIQSIPPRAVILSGLDSAVFREVTRSKFDNEESIDGFKKDTEKSVKSEDEVLPLHPKLVTSKEDSLLETKSVLQDENYLNEFLIEISVVILLVVLCIICSIPLIIKKETRGEVMHDQADQEGQQHELHQGVLRPYSARTYRPRSARTRHPIPQRPDSPYPGGDAAIRRMNARQLIDMEDVVQDDYLHSYNEAIGLSQNQLEEHFDFITRNAAELHQGVLRPYSARTCQPRSAHTPHPLPRRPDSPYPGGDAAFRHMNARLLPDTEDVDHLDYLHSYDDDIGFFFHPENNFDVDFSQNHEGQHFDFLFQEPELHQRVVHSCSARNYRSPLHPLVTPVTSLPYCPDPPPTYPGPDPGGNAAYPQLLADTADVDVDDYLPSYDEAIGQFINYHVDFSRN